MQPFTQTLSNYSASLCTFWLTLDYSIVTKHSNYYISYEVFVYCKKQRWTVGGSTQILYLGKSTNTTL